MTVSTVRSPTQRALLIAAAGVALCESLAEIPDIRDRGFEINPIWEPSKKSVMGPDCLGSLRITVIRRIPGVHATGTVEPAMTREKEDHGHR